MFLENFDSLSIRVFCCQFYVCYIIYYSEVTIKSGETIQLCCYLHGPSIVGIIASPGRKKWVQVFAHRYLTLNYVVVAIVY